MSPSPPERHVHALGSLVKNVSTLNQYMVCRAFDNLDQLIASRPVVVTPLDNTLAGVDLPDKAELVANQPWYYCIGFTSDHFYTPLEILAHDQIEIIDRDDMDVQRSPQFGLGHLTKVDRVDPTHLRLQVEIEAGWLVLRSEITIFNYSHGLGEGDIVYGARNYIVIVSEGIPFPFRQYGFPELGDQFEPDWI